MWQRIKDALNSTILWFVFLVGCIAYLWRKEKDTENALAESKAEGKMKDDEEKQSEVDHSAANIDDEYRALRDAYLRSNHPGMRQGPGGETKSD